MLDNSQPIGLTTTAGTNAISFDSLTGNVTVRTSAGVTSCAIGGSGANAPSITAFAATPSNPAPGANVTLTWQSVNATSCLASGGSGTTWAAFGVVPTSGSANVTAPQAGTTSFLLTCTGNAQQVSRAASIVVGSGGGGGSTCTTIAGYQEIGVDFALFFGGAWPRYNGARRLQIGPQQYMALRFVAGSSSTQFGTFDGSGGFPGDGGGAAVMSISPAPGCFVATELGAGCYQPAASFPGISWRNGAGSTGCKLTPGATYYLNITFGPSGAIPGTGPYCEALTCGRDFANTQSF